MSVFSQVLLYMTDRKKYNAGMSLYVRRIIGQLTPKVHAADTVGARDSFTAAFVAAYLHGEGNA